MVMMSQLRMKRERGSSVRWEMVEMRARTVSTSSLKLSFSDLVVRPCESRLATVCCDRTMRDFWLAPA